MPEAFFIGAYWGPRAATVDDCAARVVATLEAFAALHPALATWFGKGDSRDAALADRVTIDVPSIRARLERGRNRRDDDGAVIDDLGWRVALWNGTQPEASFSAQCGVTSAFVRNAVLLDADAADGDGLPARDALAAMVRIWEPDWATASTDELLDAQDGAPGAIDAGWVTYVRGDVADRTKLPAAARTEAWETGTAVVLDDADPAAVLAVRSALVR